MLIYYISLYLTYSYICLYITYRLYIIQRKRNTNGISIMKRYDYTDSLI